MFKGTLKDFSFWPGWMLCLVKRNCTRNTDFWGSYTSKVDLFVFNSERTVQFLWSMGHCLIFPIFVLFFYFLGFLDLLLFYAYNVKHKIQRTTQFLVLISHSFVVYSRTDNLNGFNFFVSKTGICLIQTFWRFLSCPSRLQAYISSLTFAGYCIKKKKNLVYSNTSLHKRTGLLNRHNWEMPQL